MQKLLSIVALSAGLVSAPLSAEVVVQGNSAFVTRDTRIVTADLRETWMTLISPAKWWNSAHTFSGDSTNMTLTPQAGGCFCERIPASETETTVGLAGSVEHMAVLLSIPDQALRMEGALGPLQSEPVNAILTVTLAKVDEGTRITFEYAVGGYMRYEVPVISKAVDGVISQQLSGLSKLLGPIEPIEDEEDVSTKEADDKGAADSSDEGQAAPDDENEEDKTKITVDDAFGDFKLEDQTPITGD